MSSLIRGRPRLLLSGSTQFAENRVNAFLGLVLRPEKRTLLHKTDEPSTHEMIPKALPQWQKWNLRSSGKLVRNELTPHPDRGWCGDAMWPGECNQALVVRPKQIK